MAGDEAGSDMLLTGGCLCGRTRYVLRKRPTETNTCFCRSCRLASGAGSVGWMTVERSSFALTGAEPTVFVSSPGVERTRCTTCGTPLTYAAETEPTIDVTLATLDEPNALAPTFQAWVDHRVSWAPLDHALPAYPEGSDGERA